MSGRLENDYKIENKTKEMLIGMPSFAEDYYYSLSKKTAKTKNAYINYVNAYFQYLKQNGFDIDDINAYTAIKVSDINKYMNFISFNTTGGEIKENGESIIRVRMAAVKSFYKFLYDNDSIPSNPCEKIELPKITKEIAVVAMTKEEVGKVKENISSNGGKTKTQDLLIFTLGCRTGLRATALVEIDISDIDFDDNKIRVIEKGKKERDVYFTDDTKRLMQDWINERGAIPGCDALFVSNRKQRISQKTIGRIIKKYTSGCIEKHITTHKMRSTYATNLYEITGDIYLTANGLGHKNIANTMRYTNVSEIQKKKAAAVLDRL